ncbi:MAG: hypothetical protein BM556_00580 [Bacteriovorax sp. MedPE-SWde]|nr:MAG: hypothetical protein BM556_00580 [Bacteriovorax sp. MedPE-SWde]
MKKILLLLLISSYTYAFTLVGSSIAVFEEGDITVNVGAQACTNVTDSPDELLNLVSEATEKFWNRVSTSELELQVGSLQTISASFYTDQICSSGAGCVPAVSSGILIVCNSNTTTFNSASKLAVALPNNVSGSNIVGAIVAINDAAGTSFNTQTREEKISVLAHEIGHAFGLGHSKFKDSLMFPANQSGRTNLGRDDWDGATFLYPKEQGPMGLCGTTTDVSKSGPGNYPTVLLLLFGLFLIGNQIMRGKKLFVKIN